jgi:deoxycytidine triphosphate deaminase
MKSKSPLSGAILSSEEILSHLERDEIFKRDSWSRTHVRGAAYDLRIASDLMFVSGPRKSVKYDVGEHRRDPIILRPGDTALLSSAEKFCVPWSLAIFISIKWSLARQGLLVLTGGFVNPGFGLVRSGRGWESADDERLHFYVVNVGDRERSLREGDTIASVTFARVAPQGQLIPADSTQRLIAESYGPTGALTGFGLIAQLAEQRRDLKAIEQRVGNIEGGLQPLVSFGVYVVAAALLGVVATALLQIVGTDSIRAAAAFVPRNWSYTVDLALILAAALVILKFTLDIVKAIFVFIQGLRHKARSLRQWLRNKIENGG